MQTNLLTYSDADKRKARLELSKIRADIYDKAKYSECLCNGITTLQEYKDADIILLYFPTKSEPDLSALARRAWNDGKQVAFPISKTEECKLDFRTVSSLDELIEGAYGIREPREDAKRATLGKSALCIVPALAIDTEGYRLGYGKGYYDRFLSSFEGVAVVAIHSSLICKRLPRNDTDIPIDTIITETGAIRLK
jgi:5-formyltetrahydrofolate cyclo-ligase